MFYRVSWTTFLQIYTEKEEFFLLKVQTEFGRIKRTTHLSMQAARKNNEQEQ